MLDRSQAAGDLTDICPLCGSDRTAAGFSKAGQRYRRCRDCTLLFGRSRKNANFHASMDDFEAAYRQYFDDSPADATNLDDVVRWIESYVSLQAPDVRVLDVGTGSGKLVRHLRGTRRCVVAGIEPSAALFDTYSLDALGIEAMTLPDLAVRQAEDFDVVTALDVIEHVPDVASFLAALASITRPGGLVFITTPDAGGLLARVLGRRWHHCNAYHFSLFGRVAVAEAARRHGFDVVAMGHRTKWMPLGYLWNYGRDFLLGRRGGRQAGAWGRFAVPVNLRDTLSIVWRRTR